jgi:hypothetical protein
LKVLAVQWAIDNGLLPEGPKWYTERWEKGKVIDNNAKKLYWEYRMRTNYETRGEDKKVITRNMGQDGDGHAHFDQIWRPNITINYMGVDQNIKF